MNIVDDEPEVLHCARHPRQETNLRCGKCDRLICARCSVQTPVGARCADCAQLRRLPQFDLTAGLLLRSLGGGLVVSLAGWYLLSYVYFLRFFLAALVGAAVGEAMSRLSRRRVTRVLEVGAVVVLLIGLVVVAALQGQLSPGNRIGQVIALNFALPLIIASYLAIVKLR
ncbi:MAG: B-box zinc finger protein [Chloroflexota bacterium]